MNTDSTNQNVMPKGFGEVIPADFAPKPTKTQWADKLRSLPKGKALEVTYGQSATVRKAALMNGIKIATHRVGDLVHIISLDSLQKRGRGRPRLSHAA